MPLIEQDGEVVDTVTGELHPDEEAVLATMEQDEPEHEQATELHPTPEPEAKQPPSEKAFEKMYGQLDKVASTYIGKVSALIEGHDTGLDTCPLCAYPGLVFPYAGDASDEVIKRSIVEAYFGVVVDSLNAAPGWVECLLCSGQGYLERPTKVTGNAKLLCPDCGGMGCREVAAIEAQNAVSNVRPIGMPVGEGVWETLPTPDAWGRAPGHPHFGIPPALAGLTA